MPFSTGPLSPESGPVLGARWHHEHVRSLLVVILALASVAPSDAAAAVAVDRQAEDCTHRSVVWRVNRFGDDFSVGRLRRTNSAWGARREFKWYSTTAPGERLDPEARRRHTLRAYFRRRIAQRERLRITRLRSFYEKKRNIRHLNGHLVRRARGLPRTRFRFKGALSCRTNKLIVWSMASGDF